MIHPPAAERLMEKGRKLCIIGKIASALEAWRDGLTVTALELLDEARALIVQDMEREDNGDSGVPQGANEGRRRA